MSLDETKSLLLGIIQMLDEGKIADAEWELASDGRSTVHRHARFRLRVIFESDSMFPVESTMTVNDYAFFARRQMEYWLARVTEIEK